jgi:hypothetical protein
VLATVLAFLSLSAARAGAQQPNPGWCFRDLPLPKCRAAVVYAIGGYYRLAGTNSAERITFFNGLSYVDRHQLLASHTTFQLGVLRNLNLHSAVGASVDYGFGDNSDRVAARARYRRWLPYDVAVDFAPGILYADMRDEAPGAPGGSSRWCAGGTMELDLHLRDWSIVSARTDVVPTGRSGVATATHLGFKIDGYWAADLTALLGAIGGAVAIRGL